MMARQRYFKSAETVGFLFALLLISNSPKAAMAGDFDDDVVYIYTSSQGVEKEKGSGLLLGATGFIATARHVVEDALTPGTDITVSLKGKNIYGSPAEIFDCHANNNLDFCIIHIAQSDVRGAGVTVFPKISCGDIVQGQNLIVLGYPSGQYNGLFRVPGQIIGEMGEGFAYPTNVSVAPGMSGGPVFNENSDVIGLLIARANNANHAYFLPMFEARLRLLAANVECSRKSGAAAKPASLQPPHLPAPAPSHEPIVKIICIGENEWACAGAHNFFYTCGYPGTDDEIAAQVCQGAPSKSVRLNTRSGGRCGYSLIQATCG